MRFGFSDTGGGAAKAAESVRAAEGNTGRIFRVDSPWELAQAGPNDLVQLLAAPGSTSMVVPKKHLDLLAVALSGGELVHLHGETGTGKTALIEALMMEPGNWQALCGMRGIPHKPPRVHAVEMVSYETPGELYQRRAIRNGSTCDEESVIIASVREGIASCDKYYNVIWLREMGRVHSAAVQGGLLNLLNRGMIRLPDGTLASGRGIAWIADSNYHTEETARHTLVDEDDALSRRWTVSIPFKYMSPEEEVRVIRHLRGIGQIPDVDDELVVKIVELGRAVRAQRSQGNLPSLAPPSLYGFFAFFRMHDALRELSIQEVAEATLLGAASPSDREQVLGVFSEVFGLRIKGQEETVAKGDLL